MVAGKYYRFKVDFIERLVTANLTFYVESLLISNQIIPSYNLKYPKELGGAASIDYNSSCPVGYKLNHLPNPTSWVPVWGDGKEIGIEKWDDGDTENGNGWMGDCSGVEAGWVWVGGSPTSADTWTKCSSGFYQNNEANPEYWVSIWGDGYRVGSEVWDDGDYVSGDGWQGDWALIESGNICVGGSPTSYDSCSECPSGYIPNSDKDKWIEKWGNGLQTSSEVWDDGNNVSGDGWMGDCSAVEVNWICLGGNETNPDLCEKCPLGYTNNTAHTEWVLIQSSENMGMIVNISKGSIGVGVILNLISAALGASSDSCSLMFI